LICVTGLGLLVAADHFTQKDWEAINKGKGDAFMIIGATLYGFSASLSQSTALPVELANSESSQPMQLRNFSYADDRSMRSWASLACGARSSVAFRPLSSNTTK